MVIVQLARDPVSIRLALLRDQIPGKSSDLITDSSCYLHSLASVQVSLAPPDPHPCDLIQDALYLTALPRGRGPEACLPWKFLTRKAVFLIVNRMVFNNFKQILSPLRYSLLLLFLMLELKKK